MKLKPNEFRCAVCKQVFDKGLTDEEAEIQYKKEFPNDPPLEEIESDVVCDICFEIMKASGVFNPC